MARGHSNQQTSPGPEGLGNEPSGVGRVERSLWLCRGDHRQGRMLTLRRPRPSGDKNSPHRPANELAFRALAEHPAQNVSASLSASWRKRIIPEDR